mmetsp:Transcript_23327/g.55163  ORF Transcript_23327/g.55163 Transcript_23327/m.55163 type:complete len:94 (-) Transcript_23327:82-363(-)
MTLSLTHSLTHSLTLSLSANNKPQRPLRAHDEATQEQIIPTIEAILSNSAKKTDVPLEFQLWKPSFCGFKKCLLWVPASPDEMTYNEAINPDG